jgi:hypothetical protein
MAILIAASCYAAEFAPMLPLRRNIGHITKNDPKKCVRPIKGANNFLLQMPPLVQSYTISIPTSHEPNDDKKKLDEKNC